MPKFKADFTDTESRGGQKGRRRAHYPAGDYGVTCTKAELGRSAQKETPQLTLRYRIDYPPQFKGKEIIDNLYLTPSSMWRLRQTLEAMGMKVPSKAVNIDTANFAGKSCAVTLDDDEWDEKIYSRVVDSFLLSELDQDEEAVEADTAEEVDEDEDVEVEEAEGDETTKSDDLEDLDLDDL